MHSSPDVIRWIPQRGARWNTVVLSPSLFPWKTGFDGVSFQNFEIQITGPLCPLSKELCIWSWFFWVLIHHSPSIIQLQLVNVSCGYEFLSLPSSFSSSLLKGKPWNIPDYVTIVVIQAWHCCNAVWLRICDCSLKRWQSAIETVSLIFLQLLTSSTQFVKKVLEWGNPLLIVQTKQHPLMSLW